MSLLNYPKICIFVKQITLATGKKTMHYDPSHYSLLKLRLPQVSLEYSLWCLLILVAIAC